MSVMSATASAPAPQTSVLDNIPLMTFDQKINFCDETAEKIACLNPVPSPLGLSQLMLKRDNQRGNFPVVGPTFSCNQIDRFIVRDHTPLAVLGNLDFKFSGVVEIVLYAKLEAQEKQCKTTVITVDIWEGFVSLSPKGMDPEAKDTPKLSCYRMMGDA